MQHVRSDGEKTWSFIAPYKQGACARYLPDPCPSAFVGFCDLQAKNLCRGINGQPCCPGSHKLVHAQLSGMALGINLAVGGNSTLACLYIANAQATARLVDTIQSSGKDQGNVFYGKIVAGCLNGNVGLQGGYLLAVHLVQG